VTGNALDELCEIVSSHDEVPLTPQEIAVLQKLAQRIRRRCCDRDVENILTLKPRWAALTWDGAHTPLGKTLSPNAEHNYPGYERCSLGESWRGGTIRFPAPVVDGYEWWDWPDLVFLNETGLVIAEAVDAMVFNTSHVIKSGVPYVVRRRRRCLCES
jgi:hypothetical protein